MRKEAIICPYCGSEMRQARLSGKPYAWYECKNTACNASSPIVCGQEEAYQKAMCRYRPMQRPMTLEEIKAHIGFQINGLTAWTTRPAARPLYVELRNGSKLANVLGKIATINDKEFCPWARANDVLKLIAHKVSPIVFNRIIRFWYDEPTEAEKEAAKWEDEENETAGD